MTHVWVFKFVEKSTFVKGQNMKKQPFYRLPFKTVRMVGLEPHFLYFRYFTVFCHLFAHAFAHAFFR